MIIPRISEAVNDVQHYPVNSSLLSTCAFPLTGEFTDPQRCLYEAVLEVQETCVGLCSIPDMTLDVIYQDMLTLIGRQLQRLGIVKRGVQGIDLQHVSRFPISLSLSFCGHILH